MNFIDKIKIKNNPNIIDSWPAKKINEDIIEYAINNGYKFNLQKKGKFDEYSTYINTFRDEPEFLRGEIRKVSQLSSVNRLFNIYERNDAIQFIKQDNELSKFILSNRVDGIEDEDLIQIIDGNDELLQLAIKNYSIIGSKILAKYIADVKEPQELQEMGIESTDLQEAFIETANPEKIKQILAQRKC